MTRRTERLGALFRQELAELLRRELRDPRLLQIITITRVEVTPDLQHARVYVSVLGQEEEKEAALAALKGAAPYMRHLLGQRVVLRRIPLLHFHLDESLEEGDRLLRIIDQLSRKGGA
ncbi:MAG: 30S ribosome-binding factor RbfA [Dehalococcoidia bacterium]|jgi:ribosome-binding factor A|nr:30S ribosome-binding factor RbfA [Dehalococcoidia bacterium]